MELFRRRGNARGNASSLEEAGARGLGPFLSRSTGLQIRGGERLMVHVIPHPFIVFCVETIILIIIGARREDLQGACMILWFILMAVTVIGQRGIVL